MNAALDEVPLLVTYTIFPHVWPTEKVTREDVPWSELTARIRNTPIYPKKSACPLISMAEYGDQIDDNHKCLRYAENVKRIYGVELDYDGEKISIEQGAALLMKSNVRSIMYTSPSHTAQKPRWRALLPLSDPATPERRAEYVARANRILGGIASNESFTLSQSFYIGRVRGVDYQVRETVGRCIDHADDIEPQFQATHAANGGVVRDQTTDSELRAAFERGEGRYEAMLKLSSRWAARGLSADDIEENFLIMLGSGSQNGDGIDLKTRVRPLAESAVAKFGESRRVTSIDSYRPHRVGEMMVTSHAPAEFNEDPNEVLVDLEKMNGKDICDEEDAHDAKYATAPFDPDGNLLRFYPGGVTIWSGFPGAGKTTLMRQFICHTLHRGSSVFLASLEEDPRRIIRRLASTAAGCKRANPHQTQWFIDAYAKRFRLWGVIGITKHLSLFGLARKLATEGIRHVVIDSLMCLDINNGDYEAQRQFAVLMATTARASQIHIHLVAHPRKLLKSDQDLDLNDVAGARELGGVADNIIFIRRDPNRQSYANNAAVTPMCVSIRKQRNFDGALGDCEGWFHRDLKQFSKEQFVDGPIRYLPDDAYRSITESFRGST